MIESDIFNVKCDSSIISIINTENKSSLKLELNASSSLKFKNWSYVYFQHLRKTGGTSIVDGIFHENNLCVSNRCIIWSVFGGLGKNIDDHKEKADEMGMKLIVNEWYPFYTSHYLIYRDNKWNDVLLTTILRDPIERVYSDIGSGATFHCGGNITIKQYKEKLGDQQFLIQCAKQYQYKYTSNLYIKVFSGSWNFAINDPQNHLKKHNIDYNPKHMVNRVHLNIAKSIIQEFDVILILEMWQETSIQLKCNKIENTKMDKINRGYNKYKLEEFPKLKKLLYELNEYDIEFYQFAKNLALQKSKQCKKYRYSRFKKGEPI